MAGEPPAAIRLLRRISLGTETRRGPFRSGLEQGCVDLGRRILNDCAAHHLSAFCSSHAARHCRFVGHSVVGSSDELPEHDSNSGEQYEASVVCEELVVSGCDAPELLQFIEETLDEIALLVERLVVGERRAAIGF